MLISNETTSLPRPPRFALGIISRPLIKPPLAHKNPAGRSRSQTLDRRRGLLKSFSHECHEGVRLKRFCQKWEAVPAYTVAG
jgi:hypothetical protein